MAGTCPKCVLYNVKVIEDVGLVASWSGIANGVVWAADNGADVINMSFGATSGSSTIQLAFEYAWGKGTILTGAAGLVWSTGLCEQGDNACVRSRIESTADPIVGTGTLWLHGRINAQNSVSAVVQP